MKKIVLGFVTLFSFFALFGCVEYATTTTTEEITTTTSGTATTTKLKMDIPTDEVEINFWHIYGQGKTALLDQIIAEFEAMYPNVTITSTSQTDYNTLREKINLGISVGQVPTMALGYPDHFAGYISAGAAYALNNLIYSNISYEITDPTSTIYGEFVDVAADLSDYVPAYLAENNQYVGGLYYSMPYSKSTETMAVNRTVLKAHVAEIRAIGITISDEGFLSHTTPLTFTQLQALNAILVSTMVDENDKPITDVTNKKCAYLLNYDSSGNMYINMSRQWNAGYTNSQGDILIDNGTTKSMLNYIDAMFNNRTFALPVAFGQTYGSTNFKYGDVCMTVGSTAGVAYNIPTLADPQDSLKFGTFNVDFLQVPQMAATEGANVTLSVGSTDYEVESSLSAVQQGPNIGIFSKASTNEKLFAWLFIKYLTSTNNTALWAMNTGYLPVRTSAYTTNIQIPLTSTYSVTYTEFLQIATDFWAADGAVTWAETDERWDYLYSSMVANIAKNQTEYYQYDPAFAAGSSSAGSATVRVEAGICLEYIYNKTKTPLEALNFFKNQVDW